MFNFKDVLQLAKTAPEFKDWSAKFPKENFELTGYEEYSTASGTLKGDFLNLLVTVYLNKVRGPEVKIPKTFEKIVEHYGNANGGQARRIRTQVLKPTDPKYRNLVDNGIVHDGYIRMPQVQEGFFKQNMDYANRLTMSDTDAKKMFSGEGGYAQVVAYIAQSFADSKDIFDFTMVKELFSKMLSDSTTNIMQPSQKIQMKDILAKDASTGEYTATADDIADYIGNIQSIATLMESIPFSGDFNCKGYKHGMNPGDYVLYIRDSIFGFLQRNFMSQTYHNGFFGLPFEVVRVMDFGGINYVKPATSAGGTDTPMLPVYSSKEGNKGEMLGYNATGDEDDPLEDIKDLKKVDSLANVDAVLVQKGALFMTEQDPYVVRQSQHYDGNYTNYHAMQQNRMLAYDGSYDVIKFYHTVGDTNKKEVKATAKK